jgi:hypothetical protein
VKTKDALFGGTVLDCDMLVATELFGPGFNDDSLNISAGLGHIME